MDFSNILTKNGLIQVLGRMTNAQNATTASYPLLDMTVDINQALGDYSMLAISAEGRWQFDDTNQLDYPIIYADIVAGEQDYVFLQDQRGNQILDIYKINLKTPTGVWTTITQRDILDQEDRNKEDLTTTGIPTQFDLIANGIFLTVIPNYSMSQGIEVFINRTPSYFVSTDTTKKAGIPYQHHRYLALKPAYNYCVAKGLPQASVYATELFGADGHSGLEGAIRKYFSFRNKSEKKGMRPFKENNR